LLLTLFADWHSIYGYSFYTVSLRSINIKCNDAERFFIFFDIILTFTETGNTGKGRENLKEFHQWNLFLLVKNKFLT